jgi:hypothetical protein
MPRLLCRQIEQTDIAEVAGLFARRLPRRSPQYWLGIFAQLDRLEPQAAMPKYGYLLAFGDAVVGAILLICRSVRTMDIPTTRCNLSSWCVEPDFRAYAPLLVSQAHRHKDVTYVNVSPAPHTLPIIEAQGFERYCNGVFVAVPILSRSFGGRIEVLNAHQRPEVDFRPSDRQLLLEHAAFGCIGLWCITSDHAYPFVFRPRFIKTFVPCAQLIYSPGVANFVRFARPIGSFLRRRGRPFVIIDANGPIPGLIGTFRRGLMPKYFKGPNCPPLGDLAYTESALFGI